MKGNEFEVVEPYGQSIFWKKTSKLFMLLQLSIHGWFHLHFFRLKITLTTYVVRTEWNPAADFRNTLRADYFQAYLFKAAKQASKEQ